MARTIALLVLFPLGALAEPDSFGLGDGRQGTLAVGSGTVTVNTYAGPLRVDHRGGRPRGRLRVRQRPCARLPARAPRDGGAPEKSPPKSRRS